MKLTKEQIQKLYDFTRQHYVEYYDLQTELVDHLANAIEQHWQENPKLSFDEALKMEFKKFGVFGFMEVVEKRQSAMNKKYNKLIWKHLKEYFKIPQIIGTFSAIGILFYVLEMSLISIIGITIIGFTSLLLFFFSIFYLAKKRKKQEQKTGKKWLFKEIIYGNSTSLGLIQFPIHLFPRLDAEMAGFWLFVFSVFFVLVAICEYIIIFEIPAKAEEYLKQTYPEYDFAI
jgi:hypothetical protein